MLKKKKKKRFSIIRNKLFLVVLQMVKFAYFCIIDSLVVLQMVKLSSFKNTLQGCKKLNNNKKFFIKHIYK